jgi:hypothetical protein
VLLGASRSSSMPPPDDFSPGTFRHLAAEYRLGRPSSLNDSGGTNQPVDRSGSLMAGNRFAAVTALVLIGASCAHPPRQPASESSLASASSSPPVSVRNGELAFKGPDFTAWLVALDGSGLHPVPSRIRRRRSRPGAIPLTGRTSSTTATSGGTGRLRHLRLQRRRQ